MYELYPEKEGIILSLGRKFSSKEEAEQYVLEKEWAFEGYDWILHTPEGERFYYVDRWEKM